MVKFIKKAKDAVVGHLKVRALAGTQLTLDETYKVYFFGINGYLSGKPNKLHKLVWRQLLWRVIDKEFNAPYRKLVKDIGKKEFLDDADIVFIRSELKPYFENSYILQSGKALEALRELPKTKRKSILIFTKKKVKPLRGFLNDR